ncbi:DUF3278 domain-containing protein [Apilactobacillus micheneri]|uniref:DUF3278 domain-containing protein n=1 Tax=Apilactobacillus micheneri TaxID=1899430 RepID=A0A9Q8MTV4_9LACO|nr:DUF3278 domain-containing protein [Apilactobacillus micheneri]TPR40011.1 DUF3278 domain-containing protein [Apilactobacillus micheneri]TPR41822.1 DUF3278 domain-containing protein [Apilactobacillus micheneri]TPR44213.1 DUF3278 domain-containing protein [Apilactobacillus micheneri]TPR45837.1 DUF3278 domain-containing protein [Apilactobacillus micheneri]TPR50581.1 DUF3278 domain-containing protein [Apilactobacillus micheneri]
MNEQKESLYIKIIKHFYGIHGYFDEYKQQQVNRIGNNAFLILLAFFFIEMLTIDISALIFNSDIIVDLLIFVNIFIILIVFLYIVVSMSGLKLNQFETYDNNEYKSLIKKAKVRTIYAALVFFIGERITFFVIDILDKDNNLSIWQNIISPKENIIWGITSILYGLAMYFTAKSRIKK